MHDWLEANGNMAEVFALSTQGLSIDEAMRRAAKSSHEEPHKRKRSSAPQKSDVLKETLRKRLVEEISKFFSSSSTRGMNDYVSFRWHKH